MTENEYAKSVEETLANLVEQNRLHPLRQLPPLDETLVLVDYSNLMYRAWFVSSKRIWVACAKFFDMLRLCVKRSKTPDVPLKVIFAGESRTPLKRCDIFEEYKGTRVYTEDPDFDKFRRELPELLKLIGWDILRVDGAEADDIIASFVAANCRRSTNKPLEDEEALSKYTKDVVIFSGDRDLQQCLAWDRTRVYRAPGLFVTPERFAEEYDIPVAKYRVYKALVGDKSDNIKGVEGFGPVKAKIAINADSVAEDIWEMSGLKGRDEFALALKLVTLDTKIDVSPFEETLYFGPPIVEDEKLKKINNKVILEINRLGLEF